MHRYLKNIYHWQGVNVGVSLFRPKTEESEALAKEIDEFLAKGGKIYQAASSEGVKDLKSKKKVQTFASGGGEK